MTYFTPRRRKIGVVTLVMACMAMAGWLRSLIVADDIFIQDAFGRTCFFQTGPGAIAFNWCNARLPPLARFLWDVKGTTLSGVNVSDGMWLSRLKFEIKTGPGAGSDGDGIKVHYWPFAITLTLISVWLLPIKFRKINPCKSPLNKTDEPIPDEGT